MAIDTRSGNAPAPLQQEAGLGVLLEDTARTIADTLGFGTVAFNLYRPAWDDFEVVALHGHADARTALLGVNYPSEHWGNLLLERWERRGAYLVPHGEYDWSASTAFIPNLTMLPDDDAWHPEDALFVPLRDTHGRLLGVVSIDEPASGLRPSDRELETLVGIATQVARAIEAAQASDAARRHQRALEALFAVSEKLNQTDSVDEVLQSVCDGIRNALGFELVVVELADETTDRYRTVAAAGADRDQETLQLDVPLAQLRRVYDSDFEIEGCYLLPREEALARVGAEPSNFASETNGHGRRAWDRHWLIVPLFGNDGGEVGFVWVDNPADRLLPTREQLLALRLFANQAMRALANAQQVDALRASEETQSAMIDGSPTGIVVLDIDGCVRRWNAAARAMYGYADEDVLGKIPPWVGDPEGFLYRFADLLDTPDSDQEFVDTRADGAHIRVRTRAAALRDGDGNPTAVIATILDVTDRWAAKVELAGRNAELEALYGTTLELIDGLDVGRVLETIVERATALVDADAGFLYLVDEEADALKLAVSLGDFERQLDGRALRRGEGVSGVVWARNEPFVVDEYDAWSSRRGGYGQSVCNAVAAVPIRSKEGVAGVLGIGYRTAGRRFEDAEIGLVDRFAQLASLALANARLYEDAQRELLERRQAQDALRVSEDLYRKVVENSADLISLLDLEGRVVFASHSYGEVLGWTPDELVGRKLADLVHPDDLERVGVTLESVLTGDPVTTRARLEHRDGRWLLIEGTPVPILDAQGKPELILAVARDVTERDRLEEQLRESQKMDAVGRLAGGIAHDFNNLLTAIGGYGELALTKLPDDSPARRSIEEIRRAAERAATLTRQLLAFSRKQVLRPEVLDLNAVVRGMEAMLARLLGEHVQLLTRLNAELGYTRADRGQLEQVLMNLALNARDAMPGGGRLVVETANVTLDERADELLTGAVPGDYVRLSVIDTGEGMSRETLDRAFEPFFTTKGTGKGTGLGLASVYGIVKQTGGGVWASSEEGLGSRFDVLLPRVVADEEAAPQEVATEGRSGSETILLVEDEELVRDLVREMLEARGYSVLEAADGAQAIAIATSHRGRISALVTDVVMPGASGPEVARTLVAANPRLRVLFTSGYAEDAISSHGELTPGAVFLSKPFSAADLAGKLRELLDR